LEGTVAESKSAASLWMDEELEAERVRAAQLGDREAYRQLIHHYERPVYRLAYALTRNHDEATALAVETFDRGLAEITRLPEGKRFFPWLLRFARNLSVTRARRRADAGAKALGGTAAGNPSPANSEAHPVELEQRLLDALCELRPDEQMALALKVGERLSYADIATLLDHSAGVTLSRLSSARALLLTRTREGIGDLS
jgi:RNA polymerase sigma-70 factor (ECF subfamily)